MKSEEYLKTGELDQALAALSEEIRSKPEKAELRIFLFQLLSVQGQWARAMNQLNVAAEMDSDAMLMARAYRAALQCEAVRADVFAGERSPLIFGEPLEWVVWMTQVASLLAAGNLAAAADLRDRAFDAAPAITGQIDGQRFSWVADADPRLGPILEAIINGNYYWIPFQRIQRIRISKPVNLRDVVWLPATFTWANQGEAAGLIPSRYPGSERESSAYQLGRKTGWRELGDGFYSGLGQRVLATDQDEYPLLQIRDLLLDIPAGDQVGETNDG